MAKSPTMEGAPQKSATSSFTIQIGLLTQEMELVPIRRPNTRGGRASLVNICPTCKVRLTQKLVCADHGTFRDSQEVAPELRTEKARETELGLVPLSAADVAAIADPRPVRFLELQVCERDELTPITHPDTNAYRVRPGKHFSPMSYNILKRLVANPKYICYGMAKLRSDSTSAPFILTRSRGQVVLQQVIAPQDLADPDVLNTGDLPAEYSTMVDTLLAQLAKPVDMELFKNVKAENLNKLVDERIGEAVPQATRPVAVPTSEAAMLAQLEAMLASTAPKKTPKPRAPRQAPVDATNKRSRAKTTAA